MPLRSKLFSGDKRLEACLMNDADHVVTGNKGIFVSRLQSALMILGTDAIAGNELQLATYGRTTARAVLAYKSERGIINFRYQRTADNIVGKMTIQRLDLEMLAFEQRARHAGIPT